MKRKVCVVITARPSYSRIRTALCAIKKHPDLELQLVVAASALLERYGNAIQAIEKDGFEMTGSIDEKVRHAVTKLSNVHLVSTKLARERVIKLGEDPATVYHTGCPSI